MSDAGHAEGEHSQDGGRWKKADGLYCERNLVAYFEKNVIVYYVMFYAAQWENVNECDFIQ